MKSAADSGLYLDSSALAKLYVPEPDSDRLDAFLRGRRDLVVSELALTEVISAVSRRKREGLLDSGKAYAIRKALFADAKTFYRVDLSPLVHREAEQLLLSAESLALRTLDALHVALAVSAGAGSVLTFDLRMADAARLFGLQVVDLAARDA